MVSDETVLGVYRLVLCREPEDPSIIAVQMNHDNLASLLWQCIRSEEFLVRYRSALRKVFQV